MSPFRLVSIRPSTVDLSPECAPPIALNNPGIARIVLTISAPGFSRNSQGDEAMPRKTIARRSFLQQGSLAAVIASTSGRASDPLPDPSALPEAAQSSYRGSLADFEVHDRQFDSLQFSLATYEHIKPSMSFSAQTEPAARLWQSQARKRLVELI